MVVTDHRDAEAQGLQGGASEGLRDLREAQHEVRGGHDLTQIRAMAEGAHMFIEPAGTHLGLERRESLGPIRAPGEEAVGRYAALPQRRDEGEKVILSLARQDAGGQGQDESAGQHRHVAFPPYPPVRWRIVAVAIVQRVYAAVDDRDAPLFDLGITIPDVIADGVRDGDHGFPACHDRAVAVDRIEPVEGGHEARA